MDQHRTETIRNVALIAHSGAGKTSLTEAMAHLTSRSSRLGRVEEGNTISDFDPDEAERGMSINLAVVPCEWRGRKINVVDTPGYPDFVAEVVSGLRATDLRSMTQGRGQFTREFMRHQEVPPHVQERLVAETAAESEGSTKPWTNLG